MSEVAKQTLGWREWVSMPDLDVPAIKAKIDTGARTSAIHAFDLEPFLRGEEKWIRFKVLPIQNAEDVVRQCEARIVDNRQITDSGGHQQHRVVVETTLILGGITKKIELTLTERSSMMFRLLIGRTALQPEYLVDPAESFLCGRMSARRLYSHNDNEVST
ncbi:MAG: ATP-dependent zinc protease [Gammaproteobacteria bacterium]|nr:ATP-dependent zinc protease [Gammaproteobacteria bacterium]